MIPTLYPYELNRSIVEMTEPLGLDSFWVLDHLLGMTHPDLWHEYPGSTVMVGDSDAFIDPFVTAGLLGRETDRTLGMCVTDGTRRKGADLARAALTLQHTSRGGFVLGIGAGEAESILPFGYSYDRPVRRLEETLIDIRAILDTRRMPSGVGRSGIPLDTPEGKPEVWVASQGPRTMRLTARYGDGWMATGVPVGEYAKLLRQLRTDSADLDRPSPTAGYCCVIALGESRDQIEAEVARHPVSRLIALFASASAWRRYGLEHPYHPESKGFQDAIPHEMNPNELRELAERIPFELLADFALLGSADDVAAGIEHYAEVGCEHVVFADMTGVLQSPELAFAALPEMGKLIGRLQAL
jgi:phthiodiolone/phenolphthiodiolone dimycocerosates ketoreductase